RVLAVDALHRRGLVDVTLNDVQAEFPDLDPEATQAQGMGLAQMATALGDAVERGWLSEEDAAASFAHFLGETVNLPDNGSSGGPGVVERRRARRSSAGPVLAPDDPRAQATVPPPLEGSAYVAPEPVARV